MTDAIIEFYTGTARDHRGRSLDEIQHWPDERLEGVHDFIQWLFPLPEPSPVNPCAPLLTAAAANEFRARPELQARLRASLERMLQFYGLSLRGGPLEVVRAANFADSSANWLRSGNHNHLRITRILKCCTLAGLDQEARAFLECLEAIYAEERRKARPGITAESVGYWRDAVATSSA